LSGVVDLSRPDFSRQTLTRGLRAGICVDGSTVRPQKAVCLKQAANRVFEQRASVRVRKTRQKTKAFSSEVGTGSRKENALK
jgi:hypothetical protein